MSSYGGFADVFSLGTASTTNTSRRSTSTVRSRTRRLISFSEDDVGEHGRQMQSAGLSSMLSPEASAVRSRGATPSPNPSRGVSPIPMRHPSRATEAASRSRGNSSLGGFHEGKSAPNFAESSRAAVDFLDSSWSSLQSLASSVLGSDIARPAPNGTAKTHVRKPSRSDPYMRPPARATSATWGPSGAATTEIGSGTKEERQALVQAKKREALLLADTGPAWGPNPRHKRRDSSDHPGHSNVDPEHDEEALAYIHHVQATDTITGVTIRYGCQPAVFRKANGFWPSDSIQGRKTVLLPVDSCSVKGRPIRPKIEEEDFLGDGSESLEDMNGSSIAPTLSPVKAMSADASETEGDRVWTHGSWVQIEGFPAPVEIGRVPRRALGFFPRTRRKSVSYTDSAPSPASGRGGSFSISSSSSPVEPPSVQPAIFPWTRRPHADSSASRTSAKSKPGGRHQRQRSGLQLSGPGVGTLDDSTAPGPALDGLSKFFAQHLPNLALETPPPNFENSDSAAAAANTPTGLDNLGGAVESWVRKMTTRAKASFNELQQPPSNPTSDPAQVVGRRGTGDLIELNDGLESRASSNLIAETRWKPDLVRSEGSSLRGRFPSPSPGTSRTRSGADRAKDD
ncbi:LysM domain protein [Aspergillus heteromorphus CBS 117.55]|uniref:LysM domain protein n=1 Tax=Aspergillus heteromorphus CBS 117.55 TaxID=1448321 RepID=A0A317US25_9EURO|nr:LysM domain protein [Aspergillus heteromorphus CBS 117.55]PWY64056.1 LysM domain protein [Aspergillus heteromorphus CBS 117.55]